MSPPGCARTEPHFTWRSRCAVTRRHDASWTTQRTPAARSRRGRQPHALVYSGPITTPFFEDNGVQLSITVDGRRACSSCTTSTSDSRWTRTDRADAAFFLQSLHAWRRWAQPTPMPRGFAALVSPPRFEVRGRPGSDATAGVRADQIPARRRRQSSARATRADFTLGADYSVTFPRATAAGQLPPVGGDRTSGSLPARSNT